MLWKEYVYFSRFHVHVANLQQFGRRVPLMVGGVWQSAWLFVFAAAGTAKNPTDNPGIGKRMSPADLFCHFDPDTLPTFFFSQS